MREVKKFDPTSSGRGGVLAMPGDFSVSLDMLAKSEITRLVEPVSFQAELLNLGTLLAGDRQEVVDFQQKMSELSRVFMGVERMIADELRRVVTIKQLSLQTPSLDLASLQILEKIEKQLKDMQYVIDGPDAIASWEELPPMDMPLGRRLNTAIYAHWRNMTALSQTPVTQYEILKEEFPPLIEQLKSIDAEIKNIEKELDAAGAAWTPGRILEF